MASSLDQLKQLTYSLIDKEHVYEEVINRAPEIIIVADQDGNIVILNSRVSQLGYSEKELVNENINLLIPERYREAHAKKLKEYTKSSPTRCFGDTSLDLYALHKDGHEVQVEISLSPVPTQQFGLLICSIIKVKGK